MTVTVKSTVVESMTIPFTISIAGQDVELIKSRLHQLAGSIKSALDQIDRRYSTYRPDSLVSQFRDGNEELLVTDAEFKQVYDACLNAKQLTNGCFDPFDSQQRYDPLGYVKGWAIELLFDRYLRPELQRTEIVGVCLNGGGDMQFASQHDFKWQIGIEDPSDLQTLIAGYQLTNGGLATSGYSKRGAHVRSSGQPDLLQVTVFAPKLATADVWATALLAAGEQSLRQLVADHQLSGCFVNQHHQLSYFNQGVITDVD
ncbi:FAD:protein FMN transferase [Nicoliella lavandulae]|uniref:FAD:protein FMN transferase n=1 Tax=Nicoliella lavandulae TaxID=3082954 RepID=A0ABU8SLV5_9LACO